MYYWHSLVSQDWYEQYNTNNCSLSQFAPPQSEICDNLGEVYENVTADVNVYDILGTCYGASSGNDSNQYVAQPHELGFEKVGGKLHASPKAATAKDYTPWIRRGFGDDPGVVPPCTFAQG